MIKKGRKQLEGAIARTIRGTFQGVDLITGTNIIPIMTSNTAPEGIASASSELYAIYAAYKAFDHNFSSEDNFWHSELQEKYPIWLKYQFATSKKIVQYVLYVRTVNGNPSNPPIDWTFEGSNDNINWVILDTRTDISFEGNLIQAFTFSNTNSYIYYKYNCTKAQNPYYINICELEMMEAHAPSSPTNLMVSHNWKLYAPYQVLVIIYDNNNKQIIADNIVGSKNTVTIDLHSYPMTDKTYGFLIIG